MQPSITMNFPILLLMRQLVLQVLLAGLLGTSLSHAAPATPQPGSYVLDGDSGTLEIRKDAQGRLTFEIETYNCYECGVGGVIQNATGHARNEYGPQCEVAFQGGGTTLTVEPLSDSCRDYCGAGGVFHGRYRIPPPRCTTSGRQAQRDSFLRQYRAQRYEQAAGTLEGLTAACATFMSFFELDQVRNDLALAQYRQGKYPQCLATLNQTVAGKAKDEADLKSGKSDNYFYRCDFDSYIEIAKATWFNKAMCTKAATKRR